MNVASSQLNISTVESLVKHTKVQTQDSMENSGFMEILMSMMNCNHVLSDEMIDTECLSETLGHEIQDSMMIMLHDDSAEECFANSESLTKELFQGLNRQDIRALSMLKTSENSSAIVPKTAETLIDESGKEINQEVQKLVSMGEVNKLPEIVSEKESLKLEVLKETSLEIEVQEEPNAVAEHVKDLSILSNVEQLAQSKDTNQHSPVKIENVKPIVFESINTAKENGVATLKVELSPEKLGKLEIDLKFENGIIKGEIKVTSEEVKSRLEMITNEVKQVLKNENIRVENFTVSLGTSNEFGHQSEPQGRQFKGMKRQFRSQYMNTMQLPKSDTATSVKSGIDYFA